MKLLKPDATTDGKIIFNFEHKGEIITIITGLDGETQRVVASLSPSGRTITSKDGN